MYADDAYLTYAGDNADNIQLHLNQDLKNVYNWLTANKLTLQSRTKVLTHQINAFYWCFKQVFFVDSLTPLSPFSMLKYAKWTSSRGYNIEKGRGVDM